MLRAVYTVFIKTSGEETDYPVSVCTAVKAKILCQDVCYHTTRIFNL